MKYINFDSNSELFTEFALQESGKIIQLTHFPIKTNLTILVGPNNSRKSRLMRKILSQNNITVSNKPFYRILSNLAFTIKNLLQENSYLKKADTFIHFTSKLNNLPLSHHKLNLQDINDFIEKYKFNTPGKQIKYTISDFESMHIEIDNLLRNFNNDDNINNNTTITALLKLYDVVLFLENYLKINSTISLTNYIEARYLSTYLKRDTTLSEFTNELKDNLSELRDLNISKYSPTNIYIPTLRGSIKLIENNSSNDIKYMPTTSYKDTIVHNYTIPNEVKIFTGLDLYDNILNSRNSKRKTRESFEEFEKFISHHFFSGKEVDIVSIHQQNLIHVFIEGEDDRALFDLGDGIQSLIILLYPIFTAPNESHIFIEEPELHLHPGFQSIFLNALIHDEFIKSKNLTFFISTHSNHLLDKLLAKEVKCSIFSLENKNKDENNYSLIREELSPNRNILKLLGVTNSSIFLSRNTIWVEGVTDRKYINHFLKLYIDFNKFEELTEDYHFSFIEYAGSNLAHYLFDSDNTSNKIHALSLSNKIFLLADKDINKDEKHLMLSSMNSENFHYLITGGIEIENILSPKAINFILKDIFKINNTNTIKYDSYENTRFGKFFEKLLKSHNIIKNISDPSGTLNTYYKNKFCDCVCDNINNGNLKWAEISESPNTVLIITSLHSFLVAE